LLRAHQYAVVGTTLVGMLVAGTSLGLARAGATLLDRALAGSFEAPSMLALWALARVVLGVMQQRASTTLGHRVATELRETLVHRVLRADIATLPSASELLTRIAHDVTQVQSLIAFRAPTLLSDAATSIALLAYALFLAPWTCLFAGLPALIALPLLLTHGRRQASAEDAARAAYTKVYEHVADTLEAALVIRHHHAEPSAEASLRQTLDAFEIAALEARQRATRVSPIPQVAALASFVLVAWHIARDVSTHALTRPDALALVIVLSLAARPMMRLASLTNELGASFASLRRIASLLGHAATEPKSASEPNVSATILIEHLHLSRAGHSLLEAATMRIRRGEMTAVVGENGAGKSSLLLALADLLPHRKVVLGAGDNEPGGHLDVAWVPQSPALMQGTVRSNVAMTQAADDARCRSVLARVGMNVDLDRLVEPGGRNLSLGERHKIALARALYLERSVLMLDEPTASLDATSTRTFLATLQSLREEHAIVIVSHDDHVIAQCDRVLRIRDKQLVEVLG
jgi:ABC-type multidrug transport system fused ATPase/permease subunit